MKIKYTDLFDEITIKLFKFNFFKVLKRNIWYDFPEEICKELLKNSYFISEADTIFTKEIFKKPNAKIAFNRFGALGDLVQLLPIARYFKKTYSINLTLITQRQYVPIFSQVKDAFDNVILKNSYSKNDYDKIIYLDGVLEMDHNPDNQESNFHRVHLYENFFGIKCLDYDFSIPYTDENVKKVKRFLDAFN